jgi:hypothetical protein
MAQNATIEIELQSNLTFLKKKYTTGTSIIICDILAVISAILSCSIFQKICNGSCCIPANMKLAENIIPNGIHRIKYGLEV